MIIWGQNFSWGISGNPPTGIIDDNPFTLQEDTLKDGGVSDPPTDIVHDNIF